MAPVSKTVRFEVFKRDGFVCQYCGAKPPSVVLEVDHIHPASAGGTIDNLVTACFDCNRGKGARLLSSVPPSVALDQRQLMEAAYSATGRFPHDVERAIKYFCGICWRLIRGEA